MSNTSLLREKRLGRGLSLQAVGEATGVPRSTLHRMETGQERRPKKEHVRALYLYFDQEIALSDIWDPTFDADVAGVRE